jgi:hypothetical protein
MYWKLQIRVGCITIVHDTVVVDNDCNCDDPATPLPTITVVSVEPAGLSWRWVAFDATFTGCCLWFSYTYIHPCNPARCRTAYRKRKTRRSSVIYNAGTYTLYVYSGWLRKSGAANGRSTVYQHRHLTALVNLYKLRYQEFV